MTSEDDQDINLSEILNLLGYCPERIKYRRDNNKKLDEIYNDKRNFLESITTGGKAEGTALYFDSDIDRLFVLRQSVCLETTELDLASTFVFQIDFTDCSPGYCRLKLVQKGVENEWARQVFTNLQEKTLYVKNSLSFFSKYRKLLDVNGSIITQRAKKGPSLQYGNEESEYDYVSGLRCRGTSLLQRWVRRPRVNGWPDKELIKEVEKLEAHVVPVADKNSKFSSLEWRICFTKAELLLIHSLEDFDIKVYVLFKLIVKTVLKPICKEMSSYIVKNIILWMKESTPQNQEITLLERFQEALTYLRNSIRERSLKSYMIEERNLFHGRIEDDKAVELDNAIKQLLLEKISVVNRVANIKHAFTNMNSSPEQFKKRCETRNMLEDLVYQRNIVFKNLDSPNVDRSIEEFQALYKQDKKYKELTESIYSILVPDWRQRIESDPNFDSKINKTLRDMLSNTCQETAIVSSGYRIEGLSVKK